MKKRFFNAFFYKNKLLFSITMALVLGEVAYNLVISWLLGKVFDAVTAADLALLFRRGWQCALFIAVFLCWGPLMQKTSALFARRGMEQYKRFAFQAITEKRISAFSRENTGRYLSALTNDAGRIETDFLLNLPEMALQSVLFVATLVMMILYDWRVAAAAMVLSMLPMSATMLMSRGLEHRERAVSQRGEHFTASLKELLEGFAVIKSFRAENQSIAIFSQTNGSLEQAKASRRFWEGMLSIVGGACGMTLQFGLFFFCGVLAIRGEMTAGSVLVITNLCNCLIGPMRSLPQLWAKHRAACGLVEKLADLTAENTTRQGKPLPPGEIPIRLEGLTFGYDPEKPVLRNVSLTFEPGKSYAVVGSSGSGKSTLLSLLMGSWDHYGGSVTVGGQELRDTDPDSLYGGLSLVGQSVFLFDDTIQNNITLFRDFPEERVRDVVRRAGLENVMEQRGADYRCGENGNQLSGGERQRISIARTLLQGAKVLLVDEATAALDVQTACHVANAILDLEGLTRIVVTHRLEPSVLRRYDGIIMLKNGAVCEQGTFGELMEAKGRFYALYTMANE